MAYTPPAYNNIALDFTGAYTPPAYNNVGLEFANLGGGGLPIVGTAALDFTCQPLELWFPWVGVGHLTLNTTATLTIHIELAALTALAFLASGDLTIGYQIEGMVTELGVPVQRTIRVYDAATGDLVDQGQSDSGTGAYLIDLVGHRADVYVQCLGSNLYGPLAQGPIVPDRR